MGVDTDINVLHLLFVCDLGIETQETLLTDVPLITALTVVCVVTIVCDCQVKGWLILLGLHLVSGRHVPAG